MYGECKSYPGLMFFPSPTSGSISKIFPFFGCLAGEETELALTSTFDGVTAPDTLSTVTGFLRDDCGSDSDGVGSGYGLAHGLSSSTVPGNELCSGETSLGDGCGVASVIRTAGAPWEWVVVWVVVWVVRRSLSSAPVGVSERFLAAGLRDGEVCVWITFRFPPDFFRFVLRVTTVSSSYGNTRPDLQYHYQSI